MTTRTCSWLIGPHDGPEGLAGCVTLTVDGQRSHYRLREVRSDDMGRVVELAKELRDGSFAEPYRVVLPAWGRGRCSCPGHRYGGACRHVDSLTILLNKASVAA